MARSRGEYAQWLLLLALFLGPPVVVLVEPFHFLLDVVLPNPAFLVAGLNATKNAAASEVRLLRNGSLPVMPGEYRHLGVPPLLHMPAHLWPRAEEPLPDWEKRARPLFWAAFSLCGLAIGCVLGCCILKSRCISGRDHSVSDRDTQSLLQRERRREFCSLAVIAHLIIITKVVLHAAGTGRLSGWTGVDYEAYVLVLMYGTCWLLVQACAVRLTRHRRNVFSGWDFASAAAFTSIPFLADPLDALKDTIFAGVAWSCGTVFTRTVAILSLFHVWLFRAFMLKDDTLRPELEEAYLSVLLIQPVVKQEPPEQLLHEETVLPEDAIMEMNGKSRGCCSGGCAGGCAGDGGCTAGCSTCRLAILLKLLSQVSSERQRALRLEDGPQVALALLFSLVHGMQPWVLVVNVGLPMIRYAFATCLYRIIIRREDVQSELAGEWVHARRMRNSSKALFCARQLVAGLNQLSEEEAQRRARLFVKDEENRDEEVNQLALFCEEPYHVKFRPDMSSEDVCVALLGLVTAVGTQSLNTSWPNTVSEQVLAGAFTQALGAHSRVQRLDLTCNRLSSGPAKVLAEALRSNNVLQELDLFWNDVGDEGAKALAASLRGNRNLRFLGLEHNGVGPEGALALAAVLCSAGELGTSRRYRSNGSLMRLELGYNNIGPDGARAFSEALRSNVSLEELDLRSNAIGVIGARAIAELLLSSGTLIKLKLGHNGIGREGGQVMGEALKGNSGLRCLDLSRNRLDDEGACFLAEAMGVNTTLRSLDLCSNRLEDEGAKALADALCNNTALTELDLRGNKIRDRGAQALAKAVQQNAVLQKLELFSNRVGEEGLSAVTAALRSSNSMPGRFLDHRHSSASQASAREMTFREDPGDGSILGLFCTRTTRLILGDDPRCCTRGCGQVPRREPPRGLQIYQGPVPPLSPVSRGESPTVLRRGDTIA